MTTAPSAPGKTRVLEPGVRIAGKVELRRLIAEGGMGAVWGARHTSTGASVAVKVVLDHRQEDELSAERFRHEARLGATLAHRNITRVFDLLEDDEGSLVLVMELLRGETLWDYYRAKGSLSTKEAVAIIVPILSALQHAHERGVVHRDLKPTNIFLHVDPDGQVTPKLLDFGIAKEEGAAFQTRTGDALGTPSYMSPEQVRATTLDGRSDLFSIAVVLYEIITGQNPFRGATSTAALAHVLELEVDPDPTIEPRVWLEMQRAFRKQPYERHGSAKELASALCAAVGESEIALTSALRREPAPTTAPSLLDAGAEPIVAAAAVQDGRERARSQGLARLARLLMAGGLVLLAAVAVVMLRPPFSTEPTPSTPESAPTMGSALPTSDVTTEPAVMLSARPAPGSSADASSSMGAPSKRTSKHPALPVAATALPSKPLPSAPSKSLARTPGF